MNQRPNNDKDLVDFLRQHRPPVPPASPDLEQEILQQVQASSVPRRRRLQLWLVPPAVAAGLVAAVISYRAYLPAKPSATELATLEAFIESNCQGTLSEHTGSYVWHFTNYSAD